MEIQQELMGCNKSSSKKAVYNDKCLCWEKRNIS